MVDNHFDHFLTLDNFAWLRTAVRMIAASKVNIVLFVLPSPAALTQLSFWQSYVGSI